MPFSIVADTFRGAGSIARRSFRIIKNDPHILIYPYLAVLFILITSPIVGRFVFSAWNSVKHPDLLNSVTEAAPSTLGPRLGLVTFSVFYTFFITSYFTCMIAASMLAELEGKPRSTFYGLKVVLRRFFRVTKFALLAIFFLPLGIIAQRKKLSRPRGLFDAITSSLSLNMAQLAPAIVTDKIGVLGTIRHSVDTLGGLWKESLVIRIGTFLSILLLASVSFLPKLVEAWWFDDGSAQIIGWIVTVLLGASSYVALRVIGTALTTTLYHQAKSKK